MDELIKCLDEYLESQSTVEFHLKKAERIRNEAVIPAINEMRYSGRYLAEICTLFHKLSNGTLSDEEIGSVKQKIRDKIRDANFSCLKAKHDIMDAVNGQLDTELRMLTKEFSVTVVSNNIPQYFEFKKLIHSVDLALGDSRKVRDRIDEKYDEMYKDHFPNVLAALNVLRDEDVLTLLVKQRRKTWRNSMFVTLSCFAAGAAIAGFYFQNF